MLIWKQIVIDFWDLIPLSPFNLVRVASQAAWKLCLHETPSVKECLIHTMIQIAHPVLSFFFLLLSLSCFCKRQALFYFNVKERGRVQTDQSKFHLFGSNGNNCWLPVKSPYHSVEVIWVPKIYWALQEHYWNCVYAKHLTLVEQIKGDALRCSYWWDKGAKRHRIHLTVCELSSMAYGVGL